MCSTRSGSPRDQRPSWLRWVTLLVLARLGVVALMGDPFLPGVFPVEGLPVSGQRFFGAHQTARGWVFATEAGVVHESSEGWKLWRPRSRTVLRYALPLASGGWVVAGDGFCSVVTATGHEQPLAVRGQITSAAVREDLAVLASPEGIWAVGPLGILGEEIFPEPQRSVLIASLDGQLVVLNLGDRVLRWEEGRFQTTDRYSWARSVTARHVVQVEDGRFLVSAKELLLVTGERVEPILPEVWTKFQGQLTYAMGFMGDDVVIGTHFSLSGFSMDGVERWRLPASTFGGALYCYISSDLGYLIGSINRVSILPHPKRFTFWRMEDGAFPMTVNSSRGPLLTSTSGVYSFDGKKHDFPDGTIYLLETPDGFVRTFASALVLPRGKVLHFPGGEAPVPHLLADGRLAATRHRELFFISPEGDMTPLPLPFPVLAAAPFSEGIIVTSTNGAHRLANDGAVQQSFGSGATRVAMFGERPFVVDETGTFFDDEGHQLGQLPFSVLKSATTWKGDLYVMGAFDSGEIAVGRVRFAPFSWKPLDLPLPAAPGALAELDGKLYVVATNEIMAVTDAGELAPPVAAWRVLAASDGRDVGGAEDALRPEEDTVDVVLPAARLGRWLNPVYSVSVNGGPWQEAKPGTHVRLPRLPWGKSEIRVRATLAGMETLGMGTVLRLPPWWARWPAFILYGGVLTLFGFGLVRWRTARLMRRAEELEAIVEERTAALKKAQRVREEFISTLSHEIRNPLNGVVGLCDILDETLAVKIAPRERMLVRTLQGCAGQLRAMLDDVLDFSRIDRGDIQLIEEPFELGSTVEGAARSVDPALDRCVFELPEAPLWLQGDVGKFRQVLTNLISNALKYGVPPGARIAVKTRSEADGRVRVQVSVFNTGRTIPAEELQRLFEGFVRGDDVVRKRIPGSGLGLAISRRMAEALGGTLTGNSEAGLTEFCFAAQLALGAAPLETAAQAVAKTRRALAIEDESYNRLVLGHIVGQLGYEVDWAIDGASALERLRNHRYDLVLTDYLLPDINGVELARQILAEVPEPKPPIVAVTAYSTPEKIDEARAAGISAFVTKPISRRKIEAAISGLAQASFVRPAFATDDPSVECDFAPLIRLPDGARVLAQFAESLPEAWGAALQLLECMPDEAARSVHAFRSRVLAVKAVALAEQLQVLENLLKENSASDVLRLVEVIGTMVDQLAASARARAFAPLTPSSSVEAG